MVCLRKSGDCLWQENIFDLFVLMPSCSIVIAEYNNGKYFTELYDSIVGQSISDFEVVLVDDFSTDDTVALIKEKILHDNRFKIIQHTSNKGAGAAFKKALEHASSEVILMLGADDALHKDGIKIISEAHRQYPEASLINFSLYYCDENLKVISESNFHKEPSDGEYFYWTTKGIDTFKKSKYLETGGFDEKLKSAVDQDICFKLEETGDTIHIDKVVYYYRANPKGISQSNNMFAAKINYCISVFNTYTRRKNSGFKNISANKLREITCEYYYYKAFNYDRKGQYLKSFGWLLNGYLQSKLYQVNLSEEMKKEIGYSMHHIMHQNRISKCVKKIIKK